MHPTKSAVSFPSLWPIAQYPPECPIPIPIAPLSYRTTHNLISLLVIWMSVLIKTQMQKRICGHSTIFFLWISIVKLHQIMCFVCSLSFHLNINLKWLFKTHDRIVNETFLLGVTCTRNLTRLGSWWSLGPLDQVHVGLADGRGL